MLTEETERATVRWLFGEVSLCEDAVSAGRRWPNALVFGEETSNAHLLPSARSFCDAGAMSGLAVARSSAGALPASHFSGVRARPRAHASARRAVVLQSLPTNHSELLKAAVDASRNGSLVAFFDENSDRILLPFLGRFLSWLPYSYRVLETVSYSHLRWLASALGCKWLAHVCSAPCGGG